jgi:hypothetical protein
MGWRRHGLLKGDKQSLLKSLSTGVWVSQVSTNQQHLPSWQLQLPVLTDSTLLRTIDHTTAAANPVVFVTVGRDRLLTGRCCCCCDGAVLDGAAAADWDYQLWSRQGSCDSVGWVTAIASVCNEIQPELLQVIQPHSSSSGSSQVT